MLICDYGRYGSKLYLIMWKITDQELNKYCILPQVCWQENIAFIDVILIYIYIYIYIYICKNEQNHAWP